MCCHCYCHICLLWVFVGLEVPLTRWVDELVERKQRRVLEHLCRMEKLWVAGWAKLFCFEDRSSRVCLFVFWRLENFLLLIGFRVVSPWIESRKIVRALDEYLRAWDSGTTIVNKLFRLGVDGCGAISCSAIAVGVSGFAA